MGVQCASAVAAQPSCRQAERVREREKRSGSWGEDEDRDCVSYSAWQHRLKIFIFCLLLQAVWSYRPVSICMCECVVERDVCMMLKC